MDLWDELAHFTWANYFLGIKSLITWVRKDLVH
jgi:hypothetical protein